MLTILCRELVHRYEMEVICDGQGDMPGRVEELGIPVRALALTTKWSFTASIPRLAAAVRAARPDGPHACRQAADAIHGAVAVVSRRRRRMVADSQRDRRARELRGRQDRRGPF